MLKLSINLTHFVDFCVYQYKTIQNGDSNMKKLIIATMGFLVSMGLLFLMTSFIAKPKLPVTKELGPKPIPPVVIESEEPNEPIKNTLQPPSATVEPSLDVNPDIQVQKEEIQITKAVEFTNNTNVEFSTKWTDNKFNGDTFGDFDREAIPLMQTAPNYPITALQKGLEGWVKLSFDVDPSGMAKNIKVVKSSHRNVFDKEAKRALKKWKFKPGKQNGIAMGLSNQKVTMQFNLSDN